MDINIPSILSGGAGSLGRAMQEAGDSALQSANQRAKVIGAIVSKNIKAENDQQNLIEGVRLDNDLKVQLDEYDSFTLKSTDGTEPKLLDEMKAAHTEIKDNFLKKASNTEVSNYLNRSFMADQQTRLRGAQQTLDKKLWDTSLTTIKINTDDEIRKSVQTGEYENGLGKVDFFLDAQGGYLGAAKDTLKTLERSRYTENWLKTMASNPINAPFLIQRLADPVEKKKIFANLDVNKIDEMERLLQGAGKEAITQAAFTKVYSDPRFQSGGKFSPQTAISTIFTPDGMKEFGLTPETAGQVAQMVQHNDIATKQAKKDIQEKNLDNIYGLIPSNPQGALKAIKAKINTGEIDQKEGAQLYRSLETGMLQNNVLAAQLGVFDVQSAIVAGKITDRNAVVAAVAALGPGATKDLPGLLSLLEGSNKKRGGVNYFAEAEKELNARVTETKGKNSKEAKRIENGEIQKTLLDWMNKNGVEVDNPAVMTHYRELIKGKAKWGEKAKDAVVDFVMPGEKKPTSDQELLQQKAAAKQPEAPKTQYTEAQIRQWLKEKKIKNIDEQVEIYRKQGYIKK